MKSSLSKHQSKAIWAFLSNDPIAAVWLAKNSPLKGINLEEEYAKIQQKTSKLSASMRKLVRFKYELDKDKARMAQNQTKQPQISKEIGKATTDVGEK